MGKFPYNMIWWTFIAVCYGASLRGDSPSLVELKAITTENPTIFIHIPSQKDPVRLLVDLNSTVLQLKQRLNKEFKQPTPEKQILVSPIGESMDDTQTLKSYNLQHYQELFLNIAS